MQNGIRESLGLGALSPLAVGGVAAAALIGSLAPDIDIAGSTAGNAVKPAAVVVGGLFGHRTVCHSPLFFAVIYFLVRALYPSAAPYITAFTAGAASHILLDMFNRAGIPLLWPLRYRFHIGNVETGSLSETVFRFALTGVLIICAARMLLLF